MMETRKPIFLLADSQLLFWQTNNQLFLHRARELMEVDHPRAAYVGASNGDNPVFFELFRGAMQGLGITDCRMIPSAPSPADLEYCDAADLILLAGGDVKRGWDLMRDNGLSYKIMDRYYGGAILVGVAAGAVQLGMWAVCEDERGAVELVVTSRLVPALIDTGQEPEWTRLHQGVAKLGEYVRGVGIPAGGAIVAHPDRTLEPVRRSLVEVRLHQGEIHQSLVVPSGRQEGAETAAASTTSPCRDDGRLAGPPRHAPNYRRPTALAWGRSPVVAAVARGHRPQQAASRVRS